MGQLSQHPGEPLWGESWPHCPEPPSLVCVPGLDRPGGEAREQDSPGKKKERERERPQGQRQGHHAKSINCKVQTDSFQVEDRQMLVEALTKFQLGLKNGLCFGAWRSVRGAFQARDHLQT